LKSVLEILNGIRPEFDFSTSRDFITDGMLDSFDLLTLVTELESVYGVRIEGQAILPANFANIPAIESLIAMSRKP